MTLFLVLLGDPARADAGAGQGQLDDAAGMMDREALRHAGAERVAHDVDAIELERGEEIVERVREIPAARPIGFERVGQHVARRVPCNNPELVGEARKLEAPVHGIPAHAVQQHD